MSEIRFTVTEKFDRLISRTSDSLGVSKSEYIKLLIIQDLAKSLKAKEEGK